MSHGSEYQPSAEIIERYAQILVNYALNSGEGVKPGEVVECIVPDVTKPMALALQNCLLEAGAQPMLRILPTGFDKPFFERANDQQLQFFPHEYLKAKAELLNHQIVIIADVDPFELAAVDPHKILKARDAKKQFRDWQHELEAQGKFTWTLALWGVQAKADIVGLSLEAYWDQVIKACYLDEADPIAKWKSLAQQQKQLLLKLNSMQMEKVHAVGPDMDITVKLGADRIWQGGSGRNIPSFECFTSPDWRGTDGWIQFNQPVYRYGQMMQDVRLEFSHGQMTKATAQTGQSLLDQMLKSANADKIGEYSLTDRRMSRITHVMAETLFDENISGPFGNTHLAIGMAYKDCYRGDQSQLTKEEWAERGFNDSAEHTDIVSTTDRTVTATLIDGTEVVIYRDGCFVI